MASNAKETLIKRIAGTPGRGTGANTGLGTTDVIVPEFPQLPGRLTEESIRQFKQDMDRWRAALQAQFPVPQATTATTSSTDVSSQIKTAISEALASINSQISSAVSSLNSKISQIEVSIGNSNGGITAGDVRQIIRDSHYVHTQGSPSALWTITHNLGWHPAVAIVDSLENLVHGDVIYTSENQLTVSFFSPFSGKAYLT